MEIFSGIIIFIMGLCFGSFVNMLEYRTAVKYKLIKFGRDKLCLYNKNRSFCDNCGKQLSWYENVPIFSFMMLKGKTRCCHKRLSLLYPFVELGLGILFVMWFLVLNKIYVFDYLNFWYWLDLISGLILLVFLWFSAVFDVKYMILPDFSTAGMSLCAVVLSRNNLLEALISGVVCFVFVLILHKIKIRGNEAMGGGDVKYALVIGLLLGWQKTILSLYIAFIIGAIVGMILILFKKLDRKATIPFGPFLILGTILSWWVGGEIINLLLGFL